MAAFSLAFMLTACQRIKAYNERQLEKHSAQVNAKILKNSLDTRDGLTFRPTPVTRREYLLFLAWNIDVYGESYPDRIQALLPTEEGGGRLASVFASPLAERSLGPHAGFNDTSIDVAITHLTEWQLGELLRWMTDRYNESTLIRRGFLNFNPDQLNEDCFVTEAYLANQYQGDIRTLNSITWKDGVYIPTLRMPTAQEFSIVSSVAAVTVNGVFPKLKAKDFLSVWDKYYLQKKKDGLLIINTHVPVAFRVAPKRSATPPAPATIDSRDTPRYQNLRPFPAVVDYEKNELGRFDWVIVGEDAEGNALIGDPVPLSSEVPVEREVYYLVVDYDPR